MIGCRITGPGRAGFAGRIVTNCDDDIHMRRIRSGKFVPVFGPHITCINRLRCQSFQSERMHLASWPRTCRIGLPFVFGILVLLPPKSYLHQDYDDYGWLEASGPTYNFITYYGKMVAGKWVIKMSWLWFLMILLLDSLLH